MPRTLTAAILLLTLVACATSPTGRRTLKLFGSEEMARMGAAAYLETKKESKISRDRQANGYVSCVADAVIAVVGGEWEVTVFDDKSANAFALPGGKIGVFTGMLEVAANQHQLAAVMGHEVAHVLAEHANERVSTGFVAQTGLTVVDAIAGAKGVAGRNQIMALLGLGAQVGVLLPFSRAQESEADILGLDLMARAGFDPREAPKLWQNMAAKNKGQPPEFLSTHPSHGTRIGTLNRGIPAAMQKYESAKSAGRQPQCRG